MKKISLLFLFNYIFLFLAAQPTPSSNVGIGTLTPTRAKLELHGSVLSTSAIFGGETTGMSLQSNWPGIGFNEYSSSGFRYIANGYGALQYLNPGNGYMSFIMLPNGTKDAIASTSFTAMTISNLGNIGIRTNPANASLYVRKGTNFDGSGVFGGSTYNSHFNYSSVEDTYIRGGINGSNVYINDSPGGIVSIGGGTTKVGINTYGYPPAYTLEVHQVKEPSGAESGILLVNSLFNQWETFNNLPLTFKYNGVPKASIDYQDGHYGQLSDGRLKTNITQMPEILDKIMDLRPVEYEMKYADEKQDKKIGFIAQEVKLLFPGLVTVSKDSTNSYKDISDLHIMNYSGFGVLAIKAIQEQQQQIETMKNEIKMLKEQNESIMQLLKQKK